MDRVLFLNSSGAIVTEQYPYSTSGSTVPTRITEDPLPVVPYFEQLALPTASVDTSALYGPHPDRLVTMGTANGAALTFFCDSVAGGSDWSGTGSFDDPWRSLDKASTFLSCYADTLRAAAPYVQLKVRGDTSYVSGVWQPFRYGGSRLILTGWDGRCDFSGARVVAEYFFDLRLSGAYVTAGDKRFFSGCTVLDGYAPDGLAVDCELSRTRVPCVVDCSGVSVGASVLYGGDFTTEAGADYAYAPRVETVMSLGRGVSVWQQLSIASAAVGAVVSTRVTFVSSGAGGVDVRGVFCSRGALLANCSVNVSVAAQVSGGNASWTTADVRLLVGGGNAIISGGEWKATALASAVGGSSAGAYARIDGLNPTAAVIRDVPVNLVASAGAKIAGASGREEEYEQFYNFGTSSWVDRVRSFADGVMTTGYVSSGSRVVS